MAALLAVLLAACGSSTSHHTVVSAPTATTSRTGPTIVAATGPNGPVTSHQKRPKTTKRPATKKTTTIPPTTTSTPTTPTTKTTTTTQNATKKPTPHHTTTAKAIAPLPSPVVSASSGSLRASLHGPNHAPKAGKLWYYSVEATTANRLPLAGTVVTEFVFGGQVVGREAPPTHSLKNGRLIDGVTFPPRATGIPLTFRVVVHTQDGSVTLDWPVKVRA